MSKPVEAVDELNRALALVRGLDMALEADDGDDEDALRQILWEIGERVQLAKKAIDTARGAE